jgi:hypothetical protein
MEERRFDELTRALGRGASRRQVLKGLLGTALGGVLASIGIRAPRAVMAATLTCNGLPYDPATQCCEPAGVQPRYPIANLDLCPNRVPHPGHVPEFNGCGPANGVISHLIPNKIGPYRNIDFTPACNNHDVCYDTCNSVKSHCDRAFLDDMTAACTAAYAGHGFLDRYMHTACTADAYLYYTAVSRGGADAYVSAQKQACDCCAVCQDCGGAGDDRCCNGACHDACPEGEHRDPETCECSHCVGQPDGTTCGTNEVCCQQGCVNDACPTGKTFSYGSCSCVCQLKECSPGQRLDPDSCQCVDTCTPTSCAECETCDTNTGACVPLTDLTACGTSQVCCGGFCLDSCSEPLCPSGQYACGVTQPYNPGNNNMRPAYTCCDNGSPCCGGNGYLYDFCVGSTYEDTYVCCAPGKNQCGTECCDHVTQSCQQAAADSSLHCCPADAGAVLPDGTCCDAGALAFNCAGGWTCCAGGADCC